MTQFALPMSWSNPSSAARIVISDCNRAVAEALRHSSGWPFRTAVLSGPPRSGKSLFGRWFQAETAGELVDDAGKQDEAVLFHRWNRAQEAGRPLLLIVGDDGWKIRLPDLASRMNAALQLAIGPLDDDGASELIVAHAAQRGFVLGEEAAAYLVPRVERSHAAIERVVAEIDRLSLERKVPATLSVWRDALDAVQGPEQGRLL